MATRLINLEPRINRIELGIMLQDAIIKGVKGRILKPLSGSNHSYVFMPLNSQNWETKEKELTLRCMIARRENINASEVVGLSIGQNDNSEKNFDLLYFNIPDITNDLVEKIDLMKEELGYFSKAVISRSKDLNK